MSWSTKFRIVGWFAVAKLFSALGAVCYKAQRAANDRAFALIPNAPPMPPTP